VNKRAVTWLFAALLALSANATVPLVCERSSAGDSAIVWIAPDRVEQRVEILASNATPETQAAVRLNYEPLAKARHFAPSLYQRPPPSFR
jgi:hypothetical protein